MSLKYYTSNLLLLFFFGEGGERWTRGLVKLSYVRGKNIIAP